MRTVIHSIQSRDVRSRSINLAVGIRAQKRRLVFPHTVIKSEMTACSPEQSAAEPRETAKCKAEDTTSR